MDAEWRKLLLTSMSSSDVEQLHLAGICTSNDVVCTSRQRLLSILKSSYIKVDTLLTLAYRNENLEDLLEEEMIQELARGESAIRSGSQQLDIALRGGIRTGVITEIVGCSSTGKTRLCHHLTVSSQLIGGFDGNYRKRCIYVDTYGRFRPERLADISVRYGLEMNCLCSHVTYARAYSTSHLEKLITNDAEDMMRLHKTFKLLVVDSISSLYRSEYDNTKGDELAQRQLALRQIMNTLKIMAHYHQIAVVVTNETRSEFNLLNPDACVGIGGQAISQFITTRLFLTRRGQRNRRSCKVTTTGEQDSRDVFIGITKNGIIDVE